MGRTQFAKSAACVAVVEHARSVIRAEGEPRANGLRYGEAQMDLTHADRVATIGHLAASIAHEIKQPLAAAVTSAQAASRWLVAQPPNLDEAQAALDRVAQACNLATSFVDQVRSLIRNAPPRKENLDLNETIRDVVVLIRGELIKEWRLVQDTTRGRLADRSSRSGPAATSDAQPDHECRRSNELRRRGTARVADRHRRGCNWASGSGCTRFRPGIEPEQYRSHIRRILHHQARRHGNGTVDLPFDHRSSSGTIVGECKQPQGCRFSIQAPGDGSSRFRSRRAATDGSWGNRASATRMNALLFRLFTCWLRQAVSRGGTRQAGAAVP
jgi:hypothetical protein